ncbi:MAG: DinB family protein [Candidatus Limnocylindrales bacterium]
MNTTLLRDPFGHHVWATLKLLDACAGLRPEQLETSVPGTYGPIIGTMRHLVGGDTAYLWVITGGRTRSIEDDEEEHMGLAELRTLTEANGAAWTALLAEDLDADRIVTRHRDDGTDSQAPLSVRLAQAVHHGTDHRSQVCTALTALGIEPPDIDVWAFASEGGRVVVVPTRS